MSINRAEQLLKRSDIARRVNILYRQVTASLELHSLRNNQAGELSCWDFRSNALDLQPFYLGQEKPRTFFPVPCNVMKASQGSSQSQ